MRIVASLPIAIVCSVLTAGTALADDSISGHYRAIVDGSTSPPLGESVLIVNTECDPAGNCSGWVSTPKTWGAAIDKSAGGSWNISRTDPAGWACPDGGTAPADLVYTFASNTLAGSLTATKAAGGCGDPARPAKTHRLQIQQCVDDPNRGVCA